MFFTIILTAVAIVMNVKLIPIWGMEGAALASLISYLVYYTFLLIFINWKLKILPLSLNELYTLMIIVSLFVIDWLIQKYMSQQIISLFNVEIVGQMLDSLIRTLFMTSLGVVAIYKLRISKQVNDIIDKMLSLFKKTKK